MNNDMKGNFKSPNFNKQKDKQLSARIQSVLSKNRSLPNIGTSFNNEEIEEENKSALEQAKEKVQTKATAKVIEKASGGLVQGELAEKAAKLALKGLEQRTKKIRMYIIAGVASISFLFLIIVFLVSIINDNEKNVSPNKYVTGDITEEELVDQLIYYGYCNSEKTCKDKGIYKFYTKLKEKYDYYYDYNAKQAKKNSGDNIIVSGRYSNFKTPVNTALIIETINYYQEKGITFDDYETDDKIEEENSLWSKILKLFKDKKDQRLSKLEEDISRLAWSQLEYVYESCYEYVPDEYGNMNKVHRNLYYFQISHDKFISYLAYGITSSHPNYENIKSEEFKDWPEVPRFKKVVNDICVGPHNDTISTSYSENRSSSSSSNNTTPNYKTTSDGNKYHVEGEGLGVEIANYALQFVGNPYVSGGTSLTNGADCSGFTMKVFEQFGITLPHHSTDQYSASGGKQLGKNLAVAQPGDLLVSDGHVEIYIGNNKVVHASNSKPYPEGGIKVSDAPDLNTGKWLGIVRYWK